MLTPSLKKKCIRSFVMGLAYMCIEVIWTALTSGHIRLVGHTSIWMGLVGALSAILIGQMNEWEPTYKLPIWIQCFIGAGIILTFEYVSGYVMNVKLGWDIWDYSNQWGNVQGQICPLYGFFWYLLTPFNIWFDDFLSYMFFKEEWLYSPLKIYKALVTLQPFYQIPSPEEK